MTTRPGLSLRPSHLLYLGPVTVTFFLWMFAISIPGIHFLAGLLTVPLALISLLSFLVFSMMRISTDGPLSWKVLAVGPVLGVVAITSLALGLSVIARFQLSKAGFEAYVDEQASMEPLSDTTIQPGIDIGTYEISRIYKDGDKVGFTVSDDIMQATSGFIYSPTDNDLESDSDLIRAISWDESEDRPTWFTSLGGGWYAYSQDW